MLEPGVVVSSPQIGEKQPDDFYSTSPTNGVLEVVFSEKPTELTQFKTKAPKDSQPGETVTVQVVFTDVDDKEVTRVSKIKHNIS